MKQIYKTLIPFIIGAVFGFFPAFFSEKGKNLATKQDIESITKKIEGVKAEFQRNQMIESDKMKLKHEALLESLRMVDAYFSHILTKNVPKHPTKQFASITEIRECHNKLILSLDNPEIIKVFLEIMFHDDKDTIAPTDKLNRFRNLIRKELGYGNELQLDRNKAWFGNIGFEKK